MKANYKPVTWGELAGVVGIIWTTFFLAAVLVSLFDCGGVS